MEGVKTNGIVARNKWFVKPAPLLNCTQYLDIPADIHANEQVKK